MAHALPAHLGPGDFYPAPVTDLTLKANLLIFSAMAFPVLCGAKDTLTEQPIPLGLEGAVIDGLWLFHLSMGPLLDLLRGGNANADGVKFSIAHSLILPFSVLVFKEVALVVVSIVGNEQIIVIAGLLHGIARVSKFALAAYILVALIVIPEASRLIDVLLVLL